MTKVLSDEQANAIASTDEQQEKLQTREEYALEELRLFGWHITLYEPPSFAEPDPLRGIQGGWRSGTCHGVLHSVDGRRKTLTAISAVALLDDARAWHRYQERLGPDAPHRFVIAREPVAVPVFRRQGSESERRARPAADKRKVLSFQSGVPEVVDAHGDPLGDTSSRASQYRDA